jgi:hypothetical protein
MNQQEPELSIHPDTRNALKNARLEMPHWHRTVSFRGNPFSGESLLWLISYFERTNADFGVEEVINRGEMEVSISDSSEIDEPPLSHAPTALTTIRTGCCCAADCDLLAAWRRRSCGRRWKNAAPRRSHRTGRSG